MLINEFKHVYWMDFDCACSCFLGRRANESNTKLKSSLLLCLSPCSASCCASLLHGNTYGESTSQEGKLVFKPSMWSPKGASDCSPGAHSIQSSRVPVPASQEKQQSFSLSPAPALQYFTLPPAVQFKTLYRLLK